jgi:di/tricarboxylate transporter
MSHFNGEEVLVEAVIGNRSPLVGKTPKEVQFRSTYKAAIMAIHRQGVRLSQKIGLTTLQASDRLVLVAPREFLKIYRDKTDFALISPIHNYAPKRRAKALIAIALFLVMIILPAVKVKPFDNLFSSALFAGGVMMIFKCLSAEEARQSINLQVYIVVAAAIAISTAMTNSGAGALLSRKFVDAANGSELGLQIMMYIGVSILTEIIANLPAVTLLCPVALQAAQLQGSNGLDMAIIVMLAGSSSCMM